MRAKRFTIQQRQEIFHELVITQDTVGNVRKSYEILTDKYQINDEQLRQIEDEATLRAEDHILQDREVRHQREVLVDGADAEAQGIGRRGDLDLRALDTDRAGVGRLHPGEDVHQGRLAGAILAEDRVDLARPEVERDAVIGHDRAEALADVAHLDEGGVASRKSGVGSRKA